MRNAEDDTLGMPSVGRRRARARLVAGHAVAETARVKRYYEPDCSTTLRNSCTSGDFLSVL